MKIDLCLKLLELTPVDCPTGPTVAYDRLATYANAISLFSIQTSSHASIYTIPRPTLFIV
jgi:hypothetical protein